MSSANLPQSADPDRYDEIAAIANDPGIRRHARRVAGDLAEDVLQETWYLVAQACQRGPIGNLRGYFYRTLVNTSRRMRQELAGSAVPVDDPDAAVAACRRGRNDPAAASAESDALPRLRAEARRDLVRRRQAELWPTIPPYSPAPDRYRAVILAVAQSVVTGEGPATRAEINDALTAAYPGWFSAPGVKPATLHQRRCRARDSIRLVLLAVIGRDDLLP